MQKMKKRKGENIMGKKMQKFMAALAVTAVVGFPFTNVMAASKTFTNKSITTVANNETYYKIVEKVKADNEQYWYVTITNSVNLSTSGQPRLILTSAKNKTQARASSSKLGLYKGMTGVQKMKYPSRANAGVTYKLFGTGNNNATQGIPLPYPDVTHLNSVNRECRIVFRYGIPQYLKKGTE